jgi:glycogen operon protein
MLATLLFSQGTPMVLASDEFGRSQGGNNNAYCQDNDISWVNWDIDADGGALIQFVRKLTMLRHTLPALRRGRFLTGAFNEQMQLSDVRWLNAAGGDMTQEQWDDATTKCFGLVIDGRAPVSGIRKPGSDATLLLVFNAHHDVVKFTLPDIPGSDQWSCLIDTNAPVREEVSEFNAGDVYEVTGRSLLLFSLHARGETGQIFDELKESLTDN